MSLKLEKKLLITQKLYTVLLHYKLENCTLFLNTLNNLVLCFILYKNIFITPPKKTGYAAVNYVIK